MAISEWTDQNLAEVIIIGGMVFCALSVGFNIVGIDLTRRRLSTSLMNLTSDPDILLADHLVPALG